jgi:hypothetical protein
MSRTLLSIFVVLVLANVAPAQDPLKPIALTLQTPRRTDRKLQYPLLVPVSEQRPGNAIDDYKTATKKHGELIRAEGGVEYYNQLEAWTAMPLTELPRKEIAEFLKKHQEVFDALETGAHRETADWQHLQGLREKGIAFSFGDNFQQTRGLAQLLAIRVRYDLAEGKIDKALKDLQTGFTLARHVASSPTLIGDLVGFALTGILSPRLDEVLQQPNVPNLYWSLTDLPLPFISIHKSMQGERLSVYGSFPGLEDCVANLDAGSITPEQVQICVKNLGVVYNQRSDEALPLLEQYKLGLAIEKKHEAAKSVLIASGRPKAKVEAMPHVQVALLHAFIDYDRALDELVAAQQLPYWEVLPKMQQFTPKKLQELAQKEDAPAIPLAALVIPATQKVLRVQIRTDRRFAGWRCVEALRLYAAAHDGKFPASLKDIKEVAIPLDPGTGKEFEYTVKDNTATLHAPALGIESDTYPNAFAYELTFKR